MTRPATAGAESFRAARDLLFEHRDDYEAAYGAFRWPELDDFNWASDWFDVVPARDATALWIVEEDGTERRFTFADLTQRSNQVAGWFEELGVSHGDRVLVMLANQVELWETTLAAMKLGAVIIPATTLLASADVADRIVRGRVAHVVVRGEDAAKFAGVEGGYTRIAVGAAPAGWRDYAEAYGGSGELRRHPTRASDPLLLYFTSGTTALPKLVEHTHASYPVGHLSTMYWIGLRPGDVHMNIGSPRWAKHAWSSVFAPWNAGATSFVFDYQRFEPRRILETLVRCGVTTLCAPPTVWRMLVGEELAAYPVA